MKPGPSAIKTQILAALGHPEASDGLYFRNLWHLHEEDERAPVEGDEVSILDALKELIELGQVEMDETGKEVIFKLVSPGKSASH
jgi:hypothetical protein